MLLICIIRARPELPAAHFCSWSRMENPGSVCCKVLLQCLSGVPSLLQKHGLGIRLCIYLKYLLMAFSFSFYVPSYLCLLIQSSQLFFPKDLSRALGGTLGKTRRDSLKPVATVSIRPWCIFGRLPCSVAASLPGNVSLSRTGNVKITICIV